MLTPNQKRVSLSLRTADRDLEMAEPAAQHAPHLYENIGSHCQQAVEKYLKALLVAVGLPSPYTHDLIKLIDLLQQAQAAQFDLPNIRQASVLAEFAVKWRYDINDAPSYTSADLVAMAQQFRDKFRPSVVAFLS